LRCWVLPRSKNLIWLVLGLLAVEVVGIAGLVVVLSGGLEQFALIAVCVALIVVPTLFGIALRSELRGKTGRSPGAKTPP
jgi:hypothetical protein